MKRKKKKPTKRKTEKNRRKKKPTKRKTDTGLTVTDEDFAKPRHRLKTNLSRLISPCKKANKATTAVIQTSWAE
jgi:hypothetical protein